MMPLPDMSGEGEQAAEFTHSILLLPPAERTVVRCLVKFEHSKNTGHLVEVVLGLAEAFLKFDAVKNQDDLHPFDVPARVVRRSEYVRLVNVLFG